MLPPSPPPVTCHLPERLCGFRPQYPRVTACPALASKTQPRPHSVSYNQTSKVSPCSEAWIQMGIQLF